MLERSSALDDRQALDRSGSRVARVRRTSRAAEFVQIAAGILLLTLSFLVAVLTLRLLLMTAAGQ